MHAVVQNKAMQPTNHMEGVSLYNGGGKPFGVDLVTKGSQGDWRELWGKLISSTIPSNPLVILGH
jgi:hypothetical protein